MPKYTTLHVKPVIWLVSMTLDYEERQRNTEKEKESSSRERVEKSCETKERRPVKRKREGLQKGYRTVSTPKRKLATLMVLW